MNAMITHEMTDLSGGARVHVLPDGAEYRLPRRREAGKWGSIIAGFLSIAGAALFWHLISPMLRGHLASLLLVGGLTAAIGLIGFVLLFRGFAAPFARATIRLERGRLIGLGPARPLPRRRRFEIEAIDALVVAASRPDVDRPHGPAEPTNVALLVHLRDDDCAVPLVEGYPAEALAAVAEDVGGRLTERLVQETGRSREFPVRILVPRSPSDGSELALPSQTDILVDEAEAGVSVMVPPIPLFGRAGRHQGLGSSALNALAAGAGTMFFYSVIFGGGISSTLAGIFLLLALPAVGSWTRVILDHVGERDTYVDVVDGALLISRANVRRVEQKRWMPDELVAVRSAGSAIEIDDEPLPQLEIVPKDGPATTLFIGSSREELEWIAWRIRTALEMPEEKAGDDCNAVRHTWRSSSISS